MMTITGWKSIAKWPLGEVRLMNTDNSSEDTHGTKEQAVAVCSRLMTHGFGGDRKIFPLEVSIEPITEWKESP